MHRAHGRRESPARVLPASRQRPGQEGLRARLRILSGPERAAASVRQHALGWRAADARPGAGPAHETSLDVARRTVARARADRRPVHLPDHPVDQPGKPRRRPPGRAERAHRPRAFEHRVRARGRADRAAWRERRVAGQRVGPPLVPRLLDVQEFLQQLVSGLAAGGIFASLALALVLIYHAMGLVNFAQGEIAMFAAVIAYTLISRGLSYWIAFPVTPVLAVGGGILIQRVFIRPVERAPVLTLVIITLGLATLVNGVAGFIWGYVPRSFSSPFSPDSVDLGGGFARYLDL